MNKSFILKWSYFIIIEFLKMSSFIIFDNYLIYNELRVFISLGTKIA